MKLAEQTGYVPVLIDPDTLPRDYENVVAVSVKGNKHEGFFQGGCFVTFDDKGELAEFEIEYFTHWLKEQQVYVLTRDQLEQFGRELLERAADKATADPLNCAYVDCEAKVHKYSITGVLPEFLKEVL